ncbi:MAG TPA: hypothetical protein VGK50_00825 [Coriobacteriia bacterium]|jgi:hypothetical protein
MKEARTAHTILLASLILVGMLLMQGCSEGPRVRFVGDDKTRTLADVDRAAESLQAGPAASVTVKDAPEVRQRVLAGMRGDGALAAQAADFMTRQFPPVTKAVPYYVEAARIDGRPCWVIVEAWGGRTGNLVFRRLWVFDRETGGVLDSRTYR